MTTPANDLFDALGDTTRRLILDRLAGRELPVGVLAGPLPISRPAVSQHLRVLKDAGLVVETSVGPRHYYRIDHAGLARAHDYLDSLRQLRTLDLTEQPDEV